MTRLQKALTRLMTDLRSLGVEWALIGGLAVSARVEPRATRDVDAAVVTANDQAAEKLVAALTARGYQIERVLEHRITGRIATVRLAAPGKRLKGVIVDLFFASSGVETEIVAAADPIEIWPGTVASVATTAHLLALKVLASRPRDFEDFALLRETAQADDLKTAREILALIIERGYDREKNLLAIFDNLLSQPSLADVFVERQPAD